MAARTTVGAHPSGLSRESRARYAAAPHDGSGQDGESSCTGSDTINEYSGHSSLSGAWDSPPEQEGAGAAGDVKDLSPTLPRALLPQFASEAVEREPDSWC